MKMAKATERDIDAAGDAMSVLQDISSGYYPKRDGDGCDDFHFDPEDPAHLRRFFDLMTATLDASPGWPGRVIGGMCYVSTVLEMHPRFTQKDASAQVDVAAEQEFSSWREPMLWDRDLLCPDGKPHAYVSTENNRPTASNWRSLAGLPDAQGMYWRCTACGHHSQYPF